eukprot:TRINITY_DN139_c2_g2_i2.p1 TRINITY_DN139_c2_g2~~TRINITY_DN139_c2_g2_i2.p1  ORF type:complete len:465 (-),score=246.01 TRINITY_DN139_c2_g2_i2:75-1469(-)
MSFIKLSSRLVLKNGVSKVYIFQRNLTTQSLLKDKLREVIPIEIAKVNKVKTELSEKVLGNCTVSQAYGGMRDVKSMIYETSLLDKEEGIRFRGLTIPECQQQLTKANSGQEPLPEALLWLLMTGQIPTNQQTESVVNELRSRSQIPNETIKLLSSLPKEMHPMTQLVIGVMSLQTHSKFAKAYQNGVNKKEYWEYTYEDSMDLIARLPAIASQIYVQTYKTSGAVPQSNSTLDWSANFARMMGYNTHQFDELMRLYLVIHSDHEGGNVSAHATHLVGSALSDPYLSFAAGMNGLAGPLHGLANQEVLRWLYFLKQKLPTDRELSNEELANVVIETIRAGQVVPGYGHAVLRKTDPRYTVQREFALKHLPDYPLFKLVSQLYEIIPKVLTEHSRTKNPWPNVDAHSGVLLQYYGMTEENFYTVLFGVSRALGVLSNLVWSRALGFPLERPKSVTTEWVIKNVTP